MSVGADAMAPGRVAVVAVIGALLIAGAQMGLSILTTQSTFDISSVAQQQRTLNLQKQVLNDKIMGLTSPQYLAANAAALGMVTGQSPSYLRLSDGAVLGPQRASNATSSLDALGNGSVPNALIATTPLVSNAQATINGAIAPTPAPAASAAAANPATPPALTDGLPTPATH